MRKRSARLKAQKLKRIISTPVMTRHNLVAWNISFSFHTQTHAHTFIRIHAYTHTQNITRAVYKAVVVINNEYGTRRRTSWQEKDKESKKKKKCIKNIICHRLCD